MAADVNVESLVGTEGPLFATAEEVWSAEVWSFNGVDGFKVTTLSAEVSTLPPTVGAKVESVEGAVWSLGGVVAAAADVVGSFTTAAEDERPGRDTVCSCGDTEAATAVTVEVWSFAGMEGIELPEVLDIWSFAGSEDAVGPTDDVSSLAGTEEVDVR